MSTGAFAHSAKELGQRVMSIYNVACFAARKKLDVDFNLSLDDFVRVLPQAVEGSALYSDDHDINPTGYDTSKLTAFLAYHLVKSSSVPLNTAPMFYGYILSLQGSHHQKSWPLNFLEAGLPKLDRLCANLDKFVTEHNSPIPSYTFLKGVQLALRSASDVCIKCKDKSESISSLRL